MSEGEHQPLPEPKPEMPPPRPPPGTAVAVGCGDAGQPRKETVSISLPPKRSSHPTSDRLAWLISVPTMILIWSFVTSLFGEALYRWKGDWQHTIVHALAIITLIALSALIPVQIIQSTLKEIRSKDNQAWT